MDGIKYNLLIYCALSILSGHAFAQNTDSLKSHYDEALSLPWKQVFLDDCIGSWQDKWFLDGEKGQVLNSINGMQVYAGGELDNDASHVVLWTKHSFEGDIRIEYDFTRLDTLSTSNNVNIIYFLAQGSGEGVYDKDISQWQSLRQVPAMNIYFNHMSAFHISYAVNGAGGEEQDYVRARRYIPETGKGLQDTALMPEYINVNLFQPNVKHHLTIIKRGDTIYMNVQNSSAQRLFFFKTKDMSQTLSGRVGFRQMWGRNSCYADVKIYQLK